MFFQIGVCGLIVLFNMQVEIFPIPLVNFVFSSGHLVTYKMLALFYIP
jgi:hypothetical protein